VIFNHQCQPYQIFYVL